MSIPIETISPRISIVTITYNNLEGLRKTFCSVKTQTYPVTEYIVVDGGSVDGSAEFLKTNELNITRWVSARDDGIFDAMNKGANMATGDWIIFMNAGDTFFAANTLALTAPYLTESYDVVYGGSEVMLTDRYQTRTFQRQPGALSNLWREMPICHQSFLVRRELQVQFGFDTSMKWCADHNMLVKLYTTGYKFRSIPITIAKFDASSGETKDILIHTRESWRNSKYLAGPLKRHPYFAKQYLNYFFWQHVIRKIRNILPSSWVITLRQLRGTYEVK